MACRGHGRGNTARLVFALQAGNRERQEPTDRTRGLTSPLLKLTVGAKSVLRLVVVASAVAALAGCVEKTGQVASLKPVLPKIDRVEILEKVAPGQACILRLRRAGVQFEVLPDKETKAGCGYTNAVKVTGLRNVAFSRPAIVRCPLALKTVRWVDEVVQPEARLKFGQDVKELDVYSSYSCRNARGRAWGGKRRRLSQHAYGNALDVGGFRLMDGTYIAYRKDWRKKGKKRSFLHDVSARACSGFSKVLTPDYDWHHRHHIHLDLADGTLCGYRGLFGPAARKRRMTRPGDRAER